ncbi:uncharacterized protein LOC132947127 [Metopolophium dirhodum]|uniref:uncharacterized protein LOC132947127 n=1 Tax=Metopolophium dirhodum TaxID=44670 RepID=UPI00298FB8C2|nr:uncharacterized protein LOC132947127 [Metopolophium dirhodum]
MSKNNMKRPRCTNFSATEENTLVELAAKYSNVLECKKSDHDVWQSKIAVWMKIQEQFTATTGSLREVQNLKDKYENLKRKAKKTEADRKKEVFKTGGGIARSTIAPSATHNVLIEIMGSSAVGLQNIFDGDKTGKPLVNTEDIEIGQVRNLDEEFIYAYDDSVDQPETVIVGNPVVVLSADTVEHVDHPETVFVDNPIAVVTPDTVQQQHMWAKWNPEVLKNNKSAELMTPLALKKNIKTTLGDSVKKYSLEKVNLIKKQSQYFENEEKRAQEKHNAEELRAQEKHEWERAHYKLMCDKLRYEVIDLKQVIIDNFVNTMLGACVDM